MLLLFELTHDYFIIIPTLASVGISYWVASFPVASLLQPLSPVFRLWPSDMASPLSTSAQSRTAMSDEVSAVVSDALSSLPADSVPQVLESAQRQPGRAQDDSRERGGVVEVKAKPVPQASAAEDEAGHTGRISSLGRGGGTSVSFSGASVLSGTNGRAVQGAGVNSGGAGGGLREVDMGIGLVGSLPIRPKDRQVDDLTVLCALRQACVMLTPDTSLSEALQVFSWRLPALSLSRSS